ARTVKVVSTSGRSSARGAAGPWHAPRARVPAAASAVTRRSFGIPKDLAQVSVNRNFAGVETTMPADPARARGHRDESGSAEQDRGLVVTRLRHRLEAAEGILERNRHDLRAAEGHHLAPLLPEHQVEHCHAVSGGQN